MSEASSIAAAWAPRFGDSARSIVYLKVCAVRRWFDGGENRNPDLIRNVKVRAPRETAGSAAATSGTSLHRIGAAAGR